MVATILRLQRPWYISMQLDFSGSVSYSHLKNMTSQSSKIQVPGARCSMGLEKYFDYLLIYSPKTTQFCRVNNRPYMGSIFRVSKSLASFQASCKLIVWMYPSRPKCNHPNKKISSFYYTAEYPLHPSMVYLYSFTFTIKFNHM